MKPSPMTPRGRLAAAVLVSLLIGVVAPAHAADDDALAVRATEILRTYCYRCHGVRFEIPGYNVLDRDVLLADRGPGKDPYVKIGDPDASELILRLDDMPPSGPKPSDEEKQALADWVRAGAPFPIASRRERIEEEAVLRAIVEQLRKLDAVDRPHRRFFTLTNLHNNPAVRDDEIRLARAAVSKLANSLSWKRSVAVPEAFGPAGVVLAVDTRALGWDEPDAWSTLLKAYPYGLIHRSREEGPIRDLAMELESLAGEDAGLVDIRADWFLDSASRPELYHAILDLPGTAGALERKLRVDVEADFLKDRLRRAGFATSGVSSQNRLADRHESDFGYYWKSYDFLANDGTGNLFRHPLGPPFADNPFPRLAFEHAGGEIIFSLPNRLQAYLLVDEKGKRIDSGPAEIVGDALKTSGTTLIVNGLSCMACHKDGVIRFKDQLREGQAAGGQARVKVERLVPAQADWDDLLAQDEALFLAAAEKATGPFLKVGDDRSKAIKDFPEPISALARLYQKDIGAAEVAAELGVGDAETLRGLIRANATLRRFGLAPLLRDKGTIKRSEWASLRGRTLSTFHQAALELGKGTPYRAY